MPAFLERPPAVSSTAIQEVLQPMRPTQALALVLAGFLIVFAPMRLSADSAGRSFPFELSILKDAAIGGTGLGLFGASLYFDSIKPSPNQADLDASAIPFFDRLYSNSRSEWMGTTADALMIATALVPAVVVPALDGGEYLTVGVMYAECLGIAYALDTSVKSVVTRYRPYAYSASPDVFSDPDIAASFASRHATVAFASAVFAGRVFEGVYPDSRWKPLVWGTGLALATATSVLRVASGDHFLSDIVAGAALGSLCGYLIPLLHESEPGGNSPGLAARSMPGGLTLILRY
jgi:membrane-associated phospholipid phosphatase